ncbi:MAG: hypothetical protein Q4C87_00815 [Actinomycetaceae bacterium]|nr:hypothetical protein [Actinomycetaceae bacterium]
MVNTLRRSGVAALVIAGVGIVFGTQSPTAAALPAAQGQWALPSSDASVPSPIDEDEDLTSPQSADQERAPAGDDAPQSAPPSEDPDTPLSDGNTGQSDTDTGQADDSGVADSGQSQAASPGNTAPSAGSSASHSGQTQSSTPPGTLANNSSGTNGSGDPQRSAENSANPTSPLESATPEEGVGPASVPREATRIARSEEALAKAQSAEPIIASRIARTGEPITSVILGAAALTVVAAAALFARQYFARKSQGR